MPPRHSFLIKSSGRCSGMRTKPLWSCRISVTLFKPRRADITKRNPRSKPHLKRWIVGFLLVRSRELESLALWLKEFKMHHSSNFKSLKNCYFYRIIAKRIFAHTALFAYSVMLCNRYPAIQVCKKCAKMCRRAKQSPMDKSTTGFMAGFRTSEQTPFT